MDYMPAVVQAIPGEDFTVYAYFSDGSIHHADIKPFIKKGGVFEQLSNEALFTDCLTVMNHAVAWDISGARDLNTCIDLDPIEMYETAPVVKDPLHRIA